MINQSFFTLFLGVILWGLSVHGYAADVRLDCYGVVQRAMLSDPRNAESHHSLESKRMQDDVLKSQAILPKFEAGFAFGPTPGLREGVDASGDTVDMWDFSKMGPYFGTEFKVAQPLNFSTLLYGLDAVRKDFQQEQEKVKLDLARRAVEYQQAYYGYLLALEMKRLVGDAVKQLDHAEEKIEEALDEDDESVSQNDLLNIRVARWTVLKSLHETEEGMQTAEKTLRFLLNLKEDEVFVPAETLLVARQEALPEMEQIQEDLQQQSPELRRLQKGLAAMQAKVHVSQAKLGPEFFIFGSFRYVKSWAGERQSLSQDAFSRDPVNILTGSFGIGVRYKLNFWKARQELKQTQVDLRQLQLKEVYAADGLAMLVQEKLFKWQRAAKDLEAVKDGLRASEAILKGAAMTYDVDPSQSKPLLDAYKTNMFMKKDYLMAVYHYNLAVAQFVAQVGWLPQEFLGYLQDSGGASPQ